MLVSETPIGLESRVHAAAGAAGFSVRAMHFVGTTEVRATLAEEKFFTPCFGFSADPRLELSSSFSSSTST